MRIQRSHPDQNLLFDLHPEGHEPPIAQRTITLGCLLPAKPSEFIDIDRACSILGVSSLLVCRLERAKLLRGVQLGSHMRWNIHYQSVVDLCDSLRIKFSIRDRRPRIAAGRRWRDDELLPFPLRDTVSVKDVERGLDVHNKVVLHLIEEGAFEAYRFFEHAPWRISKTSLFQYRDRKRAELSAPLSRHSRRT